MNIALDFDGTITADFPMWLDVARVMRYSGHDVRIVTMRDDRYDRHPTMARIEAVGFPIIFTRGVAKRWHCQHLAGWTPDVWIDDHPEAILNNSTASPEWLAEWRATGKNLA